MIYKPGAIALDDNIVLTITDWETLYYAGDVSYTVRIQKGGVLY